VSLEVNLKASVFGFDCLRGDRHPEMVSRAVQSLDDFFSAFARRAPGVDKQRVMPVLVVGAARLVKACLKVSV
jgi:hypothetical protein